MKKILFVHHGDTNGGAPRSLRFLIERLDRSEYEPVVVHRTNETDGAFFEEVNARTIFEPNIKPFHGSTVSGITFKQIVYNFVYALPSYFAMKRIVERERPDIVHLNSTCLFMCAAATKKVNKKTKVICHVREPLLPNIWGSVLRLMNNKFCDRFIAIDEFDGRSVDALGVKTKIVYNFVDFSVYNKYVQSTVLRDELNLQDDDVIFLILARVSPENGILEIIGQWKKVRDKHSQLVIVGEINKKTDYCLKCHAAIEGAANIHILPFRKDVPRVIASADVITCSFTQPHFARMIIEGAAMGKPAVSVNIDGPKELVLHGKTGFLYNNEEELIQAVNKFTNDSEVRQQMGIAAEQLALKKFNADINAKKTIEIYG